MQQHNNGHTICGFFNRPLTDADEGVAGGHRYGSVCKSEAPVSAPKLVARPAEERGARLEAHEALEVTQIPVTSSPGWTYEAGFVHSFRKDGSSGMEQGMSEAECILIGLQNGFKVVGHRNGNHPNPSYRETCWKQTNAAAAVAWHDKGGNPNDRAHTTITLGACDS